VTVTHICFGASKFTFEDTVDIFTVVAERGKIYPTECGETNHATGFWARGKVFSTENGKDSKGFKDNCIKYAYGSNIVIADALALNGETLLNTVLFFLHAKLLIFITSHEIILHGMSQNLPAILTALTESFGRSGSVCNWYSSHAVAHMSACVKAKGWHFEHQLSQ